MEQDQAARHAQQLLRLRSPAGLRAFRAQLSKEQAQAAINHPSIEPVDRAAIRLALAFANKPDDSWQGRRQHQLDSAIIHPDELLGG